MVSSTKRALLLLLALIIATLYYKSLFNGEDPLQVFHEIPPEEIIFKLINYKHPGMVFDNEVDNGIARNETGTKAKYEFLSEITF